MRKNYVCKVCGKTINNESDLLDQHLIKQHQIDIYSMLKSDEWDSEAIYDEYYIR